MKKKTYTPSYAKTFFANLGEFLASVGVEGDADVAAPEVCHGDAGEEHAHGEHGIGIAQAQLLGAVFRHIKHTHHATCEIRANVVVAVG